MLAIIQLFTIVYMKEGTIKLHFPSIQVQQLCGNLNICCVDTGVGLTFRLSGMHGQQEHHMIRTDDRPLIVLFRHRKSFCNLFGFRFYIYFQPRQFFNFVLALTRIRAKPHIVKGIDANPIQSLLRNINDERFKSFPHPMSQLAHVLGLITMGHGRGQFRHQSETLSGFRIKFFEQLLSTHLMILQLDRLRSGIRSLSCVRSSLDYFVF